jgi:hypothetical protein
MNRLKKWGWALSAALLCLALTACRGGMGNLFDLN